MLTYTSESLDVNGGEINVYYHELLVQFSESPPKRALTILGLLGLGALLFIPASKPRTDVGQTGPGAGRVGGEPRTTRSRDGTVATVRKKAILYYCQSTCFVLY